MNRTTFTLNEHGAVVRICGDEEVEIYIVAPDCPQDLVYRWSSLHLGTAKSPSEKELSRLNRL